MNTASVPLQAEASPRREWWRSQWKLFRRSRLALPGLLLFMVFVLCGLLAPLIAPYSPCDNDLANLMAPRPFMVERGHLDGVAPDEWVAYEFSKVRRFYDTKMNMPDRARIEFFTGPHTIHGKGTFEFLRQHLQWPR